MNFKVTENRGCGIKYPVFFGTLGECTQWLEDNCLPVFPNSYLFNRKDWEEGEYFNGNNQPYDYYIEQNE